MKPEVKPGTVAYLGEKGGEPGRAYRQFIQSLNEDETLSAKIRELVFIGVQTALDKEMAVRAHIPRALAAGASKKEIAAAMMVAVANGGVTGALRCLPLLEE